MRNVTYLKPIHRAELIRAEHKRIDKKKLEARLEYRRQEKLRREACRKRRLRRESLFAFKKVKKGIGKGKPKILTKESKVRC